ncbi:MAG: glucosylceramidase [Bacteroidetes bacterium]|nr:MAG: glucosylceramidase [Bacteroidota bacterium]
MNIRIKISLIVGLIIVLSACNTGAGEKYAEVWLTTADQSILFQPQEQIPLAAMPEDFTGSVIRINPDVTYQTMDGFGYTLNGGSARLLNEMDSSERQAILEELFGTKGNSIGVSYLRLSIGASDLSDSVFTYSDLPAGKTDPDMEYFSIEMEKVHLIPVLKEILEIFPEMKIMGSPWTPPLWMKTNNHSIGGSLKPEYYDAYALYFVKYIQAMKDEGIIIDAITVQNEPLHPGNNPSLLMKANEQAAFIRQSLGPAFREHGINTRIVIYDHNADRIDYPLEVLADEEARQYIDGTAFHLYGGKVSDISKVHEAYPDKNLYFTEQWVGHPQDFAYDMAWHVRELIVGATRNWCRNVLEWNLAADPFQKPHTPGGCTRCLGAITIDGNEIERNVAYYIIAHASKFVRPGSVRIESNELRGLPSVAFTTPDGETVLIVLNDTRRTQSFGIVKDDDFVPAQLSPGAVATYVLK